MGIFIIAAFFCIISKTEQKEIKENAVSEKSENITAVTEEEKVTSEAGQALFEEATELDNSYSGTIGLVLLNKSTNESIEINADTVFTSASLYKLYVTYAILSEVDKGNLTLDTAISNQTNATIDSYLRDTITLSVNETAIALAEILGWDVIEEFVQENGFAETTFNTTIENGIAVRGTLQTTPRNVTDLLNRLTEGTLLSETSTDYFMGLLADQQLDYALNTGLSDSISFAHKTGILDSVSHDAGIITVPNGQEYIVVVMSDGWTYAYEEAKPVFIEVGQYIMDYLSVQ
ncbi:serine hydrolase [Carnobacterium inhibens]|uniref:Serine hydrolase n=1 Tax=Carnobacterium inhibens TaxID=147709 RepID=A0ABR7TEJ0_9LACT|nr:serine hydrolase [Carnobacterium inhibens]MBC9825893.1 serine hydrolase [Carnobacterium inhibens]